MVEEVRHWAGIASRRGLWRRHRSECGGFGYSRRGTKTDGERDGGRRAFRLALAGEQRGDVWPGLRRS